MNSVPPKQEGAGKTGCTLHPRSRVQTAHKNAHEHTGSAEAFRPSLRNGFTAYIVLSSVTGLCCHRRAQEALASQELDASVGASGPHDFAVRVAPFVLRAPARPPHPAPYVRDDRDTPLLWARDGRAGSADLPDGESGIFFVRGLDRKLVICPSGCFYRTDLLCDRLRSAQVSASRSDFPIGVPQPETASKPLVAL
jgi:hypothetical protein